MIETHTTESLFTLTFTLHKPGYNYIFSQQQKQVTETRCGFPGRIKKVPENTVLNTAYKKGTNNRPEKDTLFAQIAAIHTRRAQI